MSHRLAKQIDRFTLWLGDFAPDWTLSIPGNDWVDRRLRQFSCRLVGHLPWVETDRRSVVCANCFHVLSTARDPQDAARLETEWRRRSKR